MDEGIPHLQERQLLEHRDFIGLDYSSLYMCKPKRGMKRDDTKDTYKLPHRLIEKKRRDRINECIAQLKDLLPEHLKLTTLGHLEKAVVLELTLKHLKALTALTEQQHQKILALQNGERSLKSPIQSDLDAFHSGFQTCAKEVLQYLSRFESWTPREPRCVQLINHLHAVATQFLPTPPALTQQVPLGKGAGAAAAAGPAGHKLEPPAHCVPVIQRTQPSAELAAENDTDTDSGYGGEAEARPDREAGAGRVTIKQEPPGEDSPAPKRLKLDARGGGGGGGGAGVGGGPGGGAAAAGRAPGPRPGRGRAPQTGRRPAQLARGVRRRRGSALRAAGGRRGPLLPALLLPLALGRRRLRAALPGQERPGEVSVPGGGRRRAVPAAVPRHPRPGRRRRRRRGRRGRRRLPLPVLGAVAASGEGRRRGRRDPPAARGGAPWAAAPARPRAPAGGREPRQRRSGRALAARQGRPLSARPRSPAGARSRQP